MTVGERLNQIMSERGLKQKDILDKAEPYFTNEVKISKSDLSQYVSGKTEPRSDKLYILAKALNVSEQWLLGYDDKAANDKKLTIEEALDSVMSYDGKPISDHDKKALTRIIKAYLKSRDEDENA
ncbi:helix-turn-helix domain-containing protein [Lactobacillus delbrueckii subsp. bulgaricus]